MSSGGYVAVKSEDDDDDAVLIESTPVELQDARPMVGQNAQANREHHYTTQPAYGGDGVSRLGEPQISQMSHSASMHSESRGPEVEFGFLHKRRRTSMHGGNSLGTRESEYEEAGTVVYEYEPDYDTASVVSEASYSGDQQRTLAEVLNYCQAMYDAIQKLDKKFDALQRKVSEMHYVRMKPLLFKPRPVGFSHRGSFNLPPGKVKLKLQKPFHRQSNLQDYSAPQGMPNPTVRVRLEKNHLLASPTLKPVHPMPLQQEPQQTLHRQSPPLPTIVSTHSLHAPFSVDERVPDPNIQANLVETVSQSSVSISPMVVDTPVVSSRAPADCLKASPEANFRDKGPVLTNFIPPPESVTISPELPSSSESVNPSLEFVGDPKRNVKVFGNYLMKARQKTKPKYAARYLVRMLFSKETLLCSTMGTCTRGRKALDPNKVSAVREFLASTFTNYDLGEYGRDWKTCVTNVNAMIRSVRCETKRDLGLNEGMKSSADEPQPSICVDSDNSEDDDDVVSPISQTAASSTEVKPPNPPLNNVAQEGLSNPSPSKPQSSEPMGKVDVTLKELLQYHRAWTLLFNAYDFNGESPDREVELQFLGNSLRNVQLPFSVIYVAKGKPRPELSARFLIRALFTEDVLVKSNVYGNKERGMAPLDCNKINALRDFLQENYPSFHLTESGFDWKACVAAINSTIRSLRHDHKKASGNPRKSVQAQAPCETGASQKQPPVAPYNSDTITLMD